MSELTTDKKILKFTLGQYLASIFFLIPIIWGAFSAFHSSDTKIDKLDRKFTAELQTMNISIQTVSNKFTTAKNDRKRDSADGKNDRIEIRNEVQDARNDIKEIRSLLLRMYPYNQKQLTANDSYSK